MKNVATFQKCIEMASNTAGANFVNGEIKPLYGNDIIHPGNLIFATQEAQLKYRELWQVMFKVDETKLPDFLSHNACSNPMVLGNKIEAAYEDPYYSNIRDQFMMDMFVNQFITLSSSCPYIYNPKRAQVNLPHGKSFNDFAEDVDTLFDDMCNGLISDIDYDYFTTLNTWFVNNIDVDVVSAMTTNLTNYKKEEDTLAGGKIRNFRSPCLLDEVLTACILNKYMRRINLISTIKTTNVIHIPSGMDEYKRFKVNSLFHSNVNDMVYVDITDFFGSFTKDTVYKTLVKSLNISEELAERLADRIIHFKFMNKEGILETNQKGLSLSSPLSHIISALFMNMIVKDLNVNVVNAHVYVDDIVINKDKLAELVTALSSYGFTINDSKTKYGQEIVKHFMYKSVNKVNLLETLTSNFKSARATPNTVSAVISAGKLIFNAPTIMFAKAKSFGSNVTNKRLNISKINTVDDIYTQTSKTFTANYSFHDMTDAVDKVLSYMIIKDNKVEKLSFMSSYEKISYMSSWWDELSGIASNDSFILSDINRHNHKDLGLNGRISYTAVKYNKEHMTSVDAIMTDKFGSDWCDDDLVNTLINDSAASGSTAFSIRLGVYTSYIVKNIDNQNQ